MPEALAAALAVKKALARVLEVRCGCGVVDPREKELLADLRKSLTYSRLLDKGRITRREWIAQERELRIKWIVAPLLLELKALATVRRVVFTFPLKWYKRQRRIRRIEPESVAAGCKWCRCCRQIKAMSEFSSTRVRLAHWCQRCREIHREQMRRLRLQEDEQGRAALTTARALLGRNTINEGEGHQC